MLYVPDTNIFIYALAGKNPAADFLTGAIESGILGISVVVAAEFLSGADRDGTQSLDDLINMFGTLSVHTETARRAARYRKAFSGRGLKLPDALIAATCAEHGAILVTNNLRDFPVSDIEKQFLKIGLV